MNSCVALDTRALSCDISVTAQEVLDKIALNNCVRLLRTCLKTGAILNVKVWSNRSSGTAELWDTKPCCRPFSENVTKIPRDLM